ncbi:MAG: hypothetical protein C4292_06445, partial [Nitrososphaera sp.]
SWYEAKARIIRDAIRAYLTFHTLNICWLQLRKSYYYIDSQLAEYVHKIRYLVLQQASFPRPSRVCVQLFLPVD